MTSPPPYLFSLHSHPPLPIINPSLPSVKRRNARVHSRLNEVNIAGIQTQVIAEPTPQKQKAACSSGEPHKITKAFQHICTKKENRSTTKQKVWNFALWLKWITLFNYADWEGRMNFWSFSEIAFWQKTFSAILLKQVPPKEWHCKTLQ